MPQEISNTDDLIDVRDAIARFEELETERENACIGDTDAEDARYLADWNKTEDGEEYGRLKSMLDDLKGNGGDEQWRGDWYPVSLIRDSYFETAMDEMLEDIGDLPKDLPGYLKITVDYEALQMDYSSIELDGVTYWFR